MGPPKSPTASHHPRERWEESLPGIWAHHQHNLLAQASVKPYHTNILGAGPEFLLPLCYPVLLSEAGVARDRSESANPCRVAGLVRARSIACTGPIFK